MDISFDEQSEVLDCLDKARKVLKLASHDCAESVAQRRELIGCINELFHDVQLLDTRPI